MQDNPRRAIMIKDAKTPAPTNRTLAVIDGGLD
jgi:hypothetical protein